MSDPKIRTGHLLNIVGGWEIDGTEVTATAAEINAIAGTGLDSTEFGYLDGALPGDVVASKAVIADASARISDSDLVLESLNPLTIRLGDVDGLQFDNAAISSFAAAADTAGNDVFIETEDAGASATAARTGAALDIKTGDGSAGAAAVVAGAGGAAGLTTGAGGAASGTAAGGAGGALSVTASAGGAHTGGGATGAGGAGGTLAAVAGAGGATSNVGSDNGGAGGDVSATAGAGGNASAGTGDGGAGGSIVDTAGAGGTSSGGAAGKAGIVAHRGGVMVEKMTIETAVDDTATVTAAQLIKKMFHAIPTGAAAWTLPTAALLVAELPGAQVGDSFMFYINNASAGANTITVGAGSGGTADGTLTVAQNVARAFVITLTNVTAASEAYDVWGLGA